MIGGAIRAAFKSAGGASCRLRMNTWSWASVQTPPNPPIVHSFGSGFGHCRSGSYLGALLCAHDEGGQSAPAATSTATVLALTIRHIFMAVFFVCPPTLSGLSST